VCRRTSSYEVANHVQFDCHHFTKANKWLVQRYGKDGGIDWDLNVDSEDIVEPSKTDQPTDPKHKAESKEAANAKENESPAQDVNTVRSEASGEGASDKVAGPEADIDSDEEAAMREAGF
jgi:uracil-DNA glycosylase